MGVHRSQLFFAATPLSVFCAMVVKIWNTTDGKPMPELKGHELEVRKFDDKDLYT